MVQKYGARSCLSTVFSDMPGGFRENTLHGQIDGRVCLDICSAGTFNHAVEPHFAMTSEFRPLHSSTN